jgi:hypothetical protein
MSASTIASKRFALAAGLLQGTFGVALLADPYAWAKSFRWKPEPQTDVGLYFGRCLGAVAMGFAVEGLRASRDPQDGAAWYRATEVGAWLLAAVHVRGMAEGRQPLSETAEIPGWAALAVGARRFAP